MGEHISLTVNGARRDLEVEPRRLLVEALRDWLRAGYRLAAHGITRAGSAAR